MANVEDVIKAWNCCNPYNRKCKECPYEKDCYHDGISRHMVADAVKLLKAQQANLEALLPVLHGEWIDKTYQYIGSCFATCSLCGEGSSGYAKDTGFGYDYSFPNYCPHCGAKMELEH